MEESSRIRELFIELYNGSPWLDVTLSGTLSNISAEKASAKPISGNSIWEITNHIIDWRENVLQRITGIEIESPTHNYFVAIEDTSEIAWKQSLDKLSDSQMRWENFLAKISDTELSDVYLPNGLSHYKHIHGIIQHDAYHLGQIVLIAKHLV